MEASVFFTFWGLFAIVKPGVRITGENWMQKMMSVMNPGSAQKAKLSHYQFLGAGPAMFKKLADDHHVAKPEELIATAQDLGVRLIPCQMTMDLLGLKRRGPARRARGADRRRHRDRRDARRRGLAVHLARATGVDVEPHVVDHGLVERRRRHRARSPPRRRRASPATSPPRITVAQVRPRGRRRGSGRRLVLEPAVGRRRTRRPAAGRWSPPGPAYRFVASRSCPSAADAAITRARLPRAAALGDERRRRGASPPRGSRTAARGR